MIDQPFNEPDVEVEKVETVFQGYFRMDRWTLRRRSFEAGWSGLMTREVLERGHATAVLPYDPVRDEVALIEQYRVGCHASLDSPAWLGERPTPWLIEVVAGIIDEGETPEAVARRETLEEAGLDIEILEHISTFLVSPGAVSETIAAYVAKVDTSKAGGVHGLDQEHEDIRVLTLPVGDAFQLVRSGQMNNVTGLAMLMWLELNHETLRERWLRR